MRRLKKEDQLETLKPYSVKGYGSRVALLMKYLVQDDSNLSAFFRDVVEAKIKFYQKKFGA